MKYTRYVDYVKAIPENWELKWVNYTGTKIKKYINDAIKEFNLKTSYRYEN